MTPQKHVHTLTEVKVQNITYRVYVKKKDNVHSGDKKYVTGDQFFLYEPEKMER